MSRSKWKGPYIEPKLLKLKKQMKEQRKLLLATRNSLIISKFLGLTFAIYNGKKYVTLDVTEQMIGHKFGEFAQTRVSFQLKKTNDWKSKYIERKTTEFSVYSKRDIEIRKFLVKFFQDHKITVSTCKLYYLNNSIHIFISYHQHWSALEAEYSLKSWKNKLFLSLTSFTTKKYNFFIVLKRLNINAKQILVNKKINKLCKKNLLNLRKYNISTAQSKKQNSFFQKGINLLFNCVTNKKCARLLSYFIIAQLKALDKLKRHNFFINFIKNTLKLFKNNNYSQFKGIKIKIKGRLNGRPRSKSKTIEISNSVSTITIDSIIDYSSQTAFTANGTLGVKVWIHETC